jgi:hypothetical protein
MELMRLGTLFRFSPEVLIVSALAPKIPSILGTSRLRADLCAKLEYLPLTVLGITF